MKKAKSNFTRIFFILGASLVLALSLIMPFNLDKKHLVASADNSDVVFNNYYSSDIILPTCYYQLVDDYGNYAQRANNVFTYCAFNFYNSSDGIHFQVSTQANVPDDTYNNAFVSDYVVKNVGVDNTFYHTLIRNDSDFVRYSLFSVRVSSLDFNCDPDYFKIQNYITGTQGMNQVIYYDKHGNFLQVSAVFYYDSSDVATFDKFFLSPRTYYLSNSLNDNSYYNSGVTDGYNNGYKSGVTDGYNNGYKSGVTDGYNNGYNVGLNTAHVYTFDRLLSAIIDVPVKTFTGLFDFDLLGVNLANFFLALLTVAVIITIVKLVI